MPGQNRQSFAQGLRHGSIARAHRDVFVSGNHCGSELTIIVYFAGLSIRGMVAGAAKAAFVAKRVRVNGWTGRKRFGLSKMSIFCI
jgi:hypothetical protein